MIYVHFSDNIKYAFYNFNELLFMQQDENVYGKEYDWKVFAFNAFPLIAFSMNITYSNHEYFAYVS